MPPAWYVNNPGALANLTYCSQYTAWTTYTNGQLIGADRIFTEDYLSALNSFAGLSCTQLKDQEVQNRCVAALQRYVLFSHMRLSTRLIGFAALTGALTSEALYNDTHQFRAQVSTIMRPILVTAFQTDLKVLEEQYVSSTCTVYVPQSS